MIGPIQTYYFSCRKCKYLDDVMCNKLNKMLNAMTLETPWDCPYLKTNTISFDECYSCPFYKPHDTICTCGITHGSFPSNCPLNKKEVE